MQKRTHIVLCLCILILSFSQVFAQGRKEAAPIPAANLTNKYLRFIKHKRVALVVNQTSSIQQKHIVDSLLILGIDIKKIFCPEHGFRGNADAGENVSSSIDSITNIPLISLYGKHKKPDTADLKDIDIVLFDVQDVGVRFYTYLSTLHYVMEACAENDVQLLVLDRPNPNADYIDGPVLKPEFSSFVGLHPVPIVYGMTIAEYAKMINGEHWLANGVHCKLQIVKNAAYNHQRNYTVPINPSPNLQDQEAIRLYPSICLFEGTVISVGRGTYAPFKTIGHPSFKDKYEYSFQPISINGMSKEPPYKNEVCYGIFLPNLGDSIFTDKKIHLKPLIEFYNTFEDQSKFFNSFFDKLAGTDELRKQIIAGMSEDAIRASWTLELEQFKSIRKKYLLYP